MKYAIEFLRATGGLLVTTNGKMSGRDFVAMAGDMLRYPGRGRTVVFDHQKLDYNGAPLKDLEMIRDFHRAHEREIGGGKSAIVVKTGGAESWYRLWSQGEKIQTKNHVKVFEDFQEAVCWVRGE